MQSTGTSCVYQSEIEEEYKQQVPDPYSGRAVWTGLTVSHQTAGRERCDAEYMYVRLCVCVCFEDTQNHVSMVSVGGKSAGYAATIFEAYGC